MLKCCSGRPKRDGAGALYKERVKPRSSAPESSIVEESSNHAKDPKHVRAAVVVWVSLLTPVLDR